MSLMNLFGVHVGFTHHLIKKVVAETDCLVFAWPVQAVMDMGSGVFWVLVFVFLLCFFLVFF